MSAPVDVLDRSSTSVFDADTTGAQGEWIARPLLARLVRVGVLLLPILLGTLAALAVMWVLPTATGTTQVWSHRALVLAVAGAVAWVSGPLAKRLLPLSVLLQLTLVFPDRAPRRMTSALEARSTQRLDELIESTQRDGLPSDAAEAARDILRLVGALGEHDRITRGHSERVRAYAVLIGEEMGLAAERLDAIGWAGLLHDIGKLTVDSAILNKPSRLTDDEYAIIKTHAAAGQKMVEPLRGWLGGATDAVGQHHERWDGGGYPLGLRGDEISLEARIMAVADVFDVITAARSYKAPSSPAEAREEIARCAGTQFDPEVVRAFLAISVDDLRVSRGPVAMLAQLPVVAMITAVGPVPMLGTAATATAMVGASLGSPMSLVEQLETPPPAEIVVEEGDLLPVAVRGLAAEPTPDQPSVVTPDEGDASSVPVAHSAPAPVTAPAPQPSLALKTASTGEDQAAYEREHADADAAAQAARRAVEGWLGEELAEIDAKDREEATKAQVSFDEDTADAAAKHEKGLADLAEDRAERDAKLAEIDQDLTEQLAKLREDRDEDLAEVDEEEADGKLTAEEARAERAAIRREYDADVAEEEAEAREDREKANEKVEKAERELREDYDQATREASEDLAEGLAENERERNTERIKARARAAEDLEEIAEDLEKQRRKIDEEYGR